MKQKRPRIREVALIAGVSTATVSRALSNPNLVSEDTRATVLAAIKATGYRPNEAAQNLRHQRTRSIVALVPDLANPFFSKILSGIATVLGPAGYNLLIADTRVTGADRLSDYAEPSRADGLIVLDGSIPPSILSGKIPIVQACEWALGLKAPTIRIDNTAAAALAIDHLADLGHRRIGHVTGPPNNVLSKTRLAGVRDQMQKRGLTLKESFIYQGDFTLESGREAAKHWLLQPTQIRPTAVFLASDTMACGFIGEVLRHGLNVPDDVSVIGFDDIELTSHVAPPLTTIHQPRTSIGHAAAKCLLAQIAQREDAQDVILPVELIVRHSTGRLKD